MTGWFKKKLGSVCDGDRSIFNQLFLNLTQIQMFSFSFASSFLYLWCLLKRLTITSTHLNQSLYFLYCIQVRSVSQNSSCVPLPEINASCEKDQSQGELSGLWSPVQHQTPYWFLWIQEVKGTMGAHLKDFSRSQRFVRHHRSLVSHLLNLQHTDKITPI